MGIHVTTNGGGGGAAASAEADVPCQVRALYELLSVPAYITDERRDWQRAAALRPVRMMYEDRNHEIHETTVYLRDTNKVGVGIIAPMLLKPGSRVDLEIPVPNEPKPRRMMLTVRRCRQFDDGWFDLAAVRYGKKQEPQGFFKRLVSGLFGS